MSSIVARTVLGIDVGGTKIDMALADTAGRVLHREKASTSPAEGPSALLARIGSMIEAFTRISNDEIGVSPSALGCAFAGVVQPERVLFAPNLPGWQDVALARRLQEISGVALVAVTNDVRAAALAELRRGALKNADPGLYLNVGTGVAAAITTGDHVLAGAHQASGEIGYMVSNWGGRAEPNPELESVVGGGALGRLGSRMLGVEVTAADLYQSTDPLAAHLVHRAIDHLATALINMCILIDPQRVVLGGSLVGSADTVMPLLNAALTSAVPFPPELHVAHFGHEASLHGAVELAIDADARDAAAFADAQGSNERRRSA